MIENVFSLWPPSTLSDLEKLSLISKVSRIRTQGVSSHVKQVPVWSSIII